MGRLQTGHSSPNIVAGPTDRARPGAWILGPGYWGLDTGAWILGPGYWGLDTGAWIPALCTLHPSLSTYVPLDPPPRVLSSSLRIHPRPYPPSLPLPHSLEPQCCICLGWKIWGRKKGREDIIRGVETGNILINSTVQYSIVLYSIVQYNTV